MTYANDVKMYEFRKASAPLLDRLKKLAEENKQLKEELDRACPCNYVEPCSPNCTCANPVMSGGCLRCCSYGSLDQRKAAAKRLAYIIDYFNPASFE